MDKRMIILAGVAAAAYFIMKKKAASADTGAAVPGAATAPTSSNVLSSLLSNLAPKPAPAPSPTPAPAPVYDNHTSSPAPAPAPATWADNFKLVWDEAKQRLDFGGGYIDALTNVRHYNDGTSNNVTAADLDKFIKQAKGVYVPNFLGI